MVLSSFLAPDCMSLSEYYFLANSHYEPSRIYPGDKVPSYRFQEGSQVIESFRAFSLSTSRNYLFVKLQF